MSLISAHRGGAGDDPALENTLIAFERAIAAGCDFVEFDVRRTCDDRLVVTHDAAGVADLPLALVLERWINDPAAWIVTTNYPERAIAARR